MKTSDSKAGTSSRGMKESSLGEVCSSSHLNRWREPGANSDKFTLYFSFNISMREDVRSSGSFYSWYLWMNIMRWLFSLLSYEVHPTLFTQRKMMSVKCVVTWCDEQDLKAEVMMGQHERTECLCHQVQKEKWNQEEFDGLEKEERL